MDAFVITGYPDICSLEIEEKINKKSKMFENVCFIEDISKEQLAILSYKLQSAKRICVNILNFKVKDFEKQIEKIKIPEEFLDNVETFEVRSQHSENTELTSPNINRLVGEQIKLKVDLKKPDITFYGSLTNHFFLGIDIIGFDMSKRPYKIANQSNSLNGAFAYVLLRKAGLKKNSNIFDPFAGSGMIPIEAAIYQNNLSNFKFENKFNGFKLNFLKDVFFEQELKEKEIKTLSKTKIFSYDNHLKHVLGMQKNAKLAGIDKTLTMSKIAIDWADTKFDENEIDFIITDPPKLSKRANNKKDVEKVYDELFYQSRFILKKTGTLAVLASDEEIPIKQAKKHNFKLKENIVLEKGDHKYLFLIFKKVV